MHITLEADYAVRIVEYLTKSEDKQDAGTISENVNVSFKGKDLKIAFNARYFTECSRNLSDEFIKLNFNLSTNPCVITPIENDDYKYLILPVRMIN